MSRWAARTTPPTIAVRDQTCLVPWLGSHEIGNTDFVRLDLTEPDSMVQLKAVCPVYIYRDLPYLGSFRSSDERLNRIWQTGASTVHLNMQDYLWDGIKRPPGVDRRYAPGDNDHRCGIWKRAGCAPTSLDLIRDGTPLHQWMNGISSYSMWWILTLSTKAEYRQHGDRDYLARQEPYLVGLLEQLIAQIRARQPGAANRHAVPRLAFERQ